MPTADDVRRLALALPEAYEDTHRRKPAFRVNKRIFAMLGVERPTASPGFFAPLSGALRGSRIGCANPALLSPSERERCQDDYALKAGTGPAFGLDPWSPTRTTSTAHMKR
jgi:hypothetical protein